ncbi:MAG: glycosyltransferase family 2 protein [Oculatellaceae cyanobacterium Prado106]|jgi:hypothetical protein|nr:glycosyltransferase family 2 protein [Oculatellaceae cyanobacterium Prado106]
MSEYPSLEYQSPEYQFSKEQLKDQFSEYQSFESQFSQDQPSEYQLKTPVVFVIFKRVETTERVFQAIRQARPAQLFVIADGARPDRTGELEKCIATRAILEQVDWDCEVLKDYSAVNLGCGRRLPTGLDWVFSQVESAIILEDDCVPHPSFFRFCDELLDRYRNDTRITSISGQNVQMGRSRTADSYYFSRYNHCWGWATWKRAWKHFDPSMTLWPEVKQQNLLHHILQDDSAVRYWTRQFDQLYRGELTTVWDYQWTFACWLQSGLGILPNVNLISNIGSGLDSTHFVEGSDSFTHLPTAAIEFPLRHPPFVVRQTEADAFTHQTLFHQSILERLQKRLQKQLQKQLANTLP